MPAFLLCLSLLPVLLHSTEALSSRNLTALETQYAPSFVPEPNERGTWRLLSGCLLTLILCI